MKYIIFFIVVIISFTPDKSLALDDNTYQKYCDISESFKETEEKLNLLWNEINKLATDKEKQKLISEQKNWIFKKRDYDAKQLMNNYFVPSVEAYELVTQVRIFLLEKYKEQLKSKNKKVSIEGKVYVGLINKKPYWILKVNEVRYILGSLEELAHYNNLLLGYNKNKTITKVVGRLHTLTIFDPETIVFYNYPVVDFLKIVLFAIFFLFLCFYVFYGRLRKKVYPHNNYY